MVEFIEWAVPKGKLDDSPFKGMPTSTFSLPLRTWHFVLYEKSTPNPVVNMIYALR
jgi:hypothetical protein